MNAAEQLARELTRVTELRERYRQLETLPGVDVRPALMLMDRAIDQGLEAAGSNDAVQVIEALKELEGFTA